MSGRSAAATPPKYERLEEEKAKEAFKMGIPSPRPSLGAFRNDFNREWEAAAAADTLLLFGSDLERKLGMRPENLKFELVVEADTTGHYMMVFPQEIAMQHNIIDENPVEGLILILCGRECQVWPVLIKYPQLAIKELSVSLFWIKNNLAPNDMVRFYKPIDPEHSRQYVIDCYKILSKKTLNQTEASHNHLHIPKQDVKHFAKWTIDEAVPKRPISMFDAEGKKWEMVLVFYKASGAVKITGNWKAFCQAHKLEAGDAIRIYGSNVEAEYLIRVDTNHAMTQIIEQEVHAEVFPEVPRKPRTIRNANTDAARPLSRRAVVSWNASRRPRTPRANIEAARIGR